MIKKKDGGELQKPCQGKNDPFPKADAGGRTGGNESVLLGALGKPVN